MKNVLLLVHDDDGQEARLQAALDITRAVSGHLTCLEVVQPPVLIGDYYSAAGEAMLLAEEREREGVNRAAIEARLEHEDVAWSWVESVGEIERAIADASRLADIIVLNTSLQTALAPDMRAIATGVALHGRKPIVATPESCRGFDVRGNALVAWDGSASVTAALRGSVPLLKLAAGIELLCVDEPSGTCSAMEGAAFLSRHDIHPRIRVVPSEGRKVADVIASECEAGRKSYCVMGAFGHGALREALFGGVTRTMLGTAKLPLLLAH